MRLLNETDSQIKEYFQHAFEQHVIIFKTDCCLFFWRGLCFDWSSKGSRKKSQLNTMISAWDCQSFNDANTLGRRSVDLQTDSGCGRAQRKQLSSWEQTTATTTKTVKWVAERMRWVMSLRRPPKNRKIYRFGYWRRLFDMWQK